MSSILSLTLGARTRMALVSGVLSLQASLPLRLKKVCAEEEGDRSQCNVQSMLGGPWQINEDTPPLEHMDRVAVAKHPLVIRRISD